MTNTIPRPQRKKKKWRSQSRPSVSGMHNASQTPPRSQARKEKKKKKKKGSKPSGKAISISPASDRISPARKAIPVFDSRLAGGNAPLPSVDAWPARPASLHFATPNPLLRLGVWGWKVFACFTTCRLAGRGKRLERPGVRLRFRLGRGIVHSLLGVCGWQLQS